MNICSKTNNYAVKLNCIFVPKHNFLPHFLKSYYRDIGNIIAASDRPNQTLKVYTKNGKMTQLRSGTQTKEVNMKTK